MKLFKLLIRFCLAVGLCAQAAFIQAETSVWKVEKDGKTLYLGGTIHVLSQKDFPLPGAFNRAFNASDVLVLETDLSGMQNPQYQAMATFKLMYRDGRTLRSVLSPNVYAELETDLADVGMPLFAMNTMSAGGISLILMIRKLQTMGVGTQGVDAFYDRAARNQGKKMVFLETPDEQIGYISRLGDGIEDEVVSYTLRNLEQLPEIMSQLTAAWRGGDLGLITSLTLIDMSTRFPDAYQSIIVDRNERWLVEIRQMLQTDAVETVFVGVGHLAGKDGLVFRLKQMGYSVEQL